MKNCSFIPFLKCHPKLIKLEYCIEVQIEQFCVETNETSFWAVATLAVLLQRFLLFLYFRSALFIYFIYVPNNWPDPFRAARLLFGTYLSPWQMCVIN